MLVWTMLLYTLGAFFALRSLISLMAPPKLRYERKPHRQAESEPSKAGSEKRAPAGKVKPSAA